MTRGQGRSDRTIAERRAHTRAAAATVALLAAGSLGAAAADGKPKDDRGAETKPNDRNAEQGHAARGPESKPDGRLPERKPDDRKPDGNGAGGGDNTHRGGSAERGNGSSKGSGPGRARGGGSAQRGGSGQRGGPGRGARPEPARPAEPPTPASQPTTPAPADVVDPDHRIGGSGRPGLASKAGEPRSLLMRATRIDEPPMLMPIDELSSGPGAGEGGGPERPQATARVRREAQEAGPSLPFSGFSVLALLVTGLAATSAGGRLRLITDPPAPEAEPEPPRTVPAPPREPTPAGTDRRALYVGMALLAAAAAIGVAAARRR